MLNPMENQQVELFKLIKENIKNELILYSCFSYLHDLIDNYSDNLVDCCLFYILSGIHSINVEIRYHSLYILSKYVAINPNYFYNFENKLEKLSVKETDRENCLLIVKMACLFLSITYYIKNRYKDNTNIPSAFKKLQTGHNSDKIDEEMSQQSYLNDINLGNRIINNILFRFTGDNLFVLLVSVNLSRHLYENFDLHLIFLTALYSSNENIFSYIFFDEPLNEDVKSSTSYPCRHEPQLVKFKDWNTSFFIKAFDIIIIDQNEQTELTLKDYKFLNFLVKGRLDPRYSEVYKHSFRFSKLIIQDLIYLDKCTNNLNILESFFLCEPIAKHVQEECHDNLQKLFNQIANDKKDNIIKCKEAIISAFKKWIPNTSSILKDGLRKLFEILLPQGNMMI
jgi:hypothetical protein